MVPYKTRKRPTIETLINVAKMGSRLGLGSRVKCSGLRVITEVLLSLKRTKLKPQTILKGSLDFESRVT